MPTPDQIPGGTFDRMKLIHRAEGAPYEYYHSLLAVCGGCIIGWLRYDDIITPSP